MLTKLRQLALGMFLALQAVSGAVAQDVAVPKLTDRVVDTAGMLSPQKQAELARQLAAVESEYGSQIAVLIVPTTQPLTIEQYGIEAVEQWRLGRAEVDDGILILVASEDRKMRLEVGYGLEGAVPDAIAKRIIEERMKPSFRAGDFAGGLSSAVDALALRIAGEELPEPQQQWQGSNTGDWDNFLYVMLLPLIFFSVALRAWFGRLLGSLVAGGITGFMVWVLVGSLSVAIIGGIIAALVTLVAGGFGGGSSGRSSPIFTGGSGGWSSGGWSSGSSGGGFSSGGFSGGGGSFGGGGASGGW